MCEKELTPEKLALDLLQKRIIYLDGDINNAMSAKFGKGLVWLNAQSCDIPITLYIDSPGGMVSAGLDIYDMIRHSKAPVNGIVYRCAGSMAAVILQACASRKALPNSELLVHSITMGGLPLSEIEKNITKALKTSRENQSKINAIYQKRTGLPLRTLNKMNLEDKKVTAQEALELGLIDEILDDK